MLLASGEADSNIGLLSLAVIVSSLGIAHWLLQRIARKDVRADLKASPESAAEILARLRLSPSDRLLTRFWKRRATSMAKRLMLAPDDDWSWLWRARLRILIFLLAPPEHRQSVSSDVAQQAVLTEPPEPSEHVPLTGARDAPTESMDSYTSPRPPARMDWAPPWSRDGGALGTVLSRIQSNVTDAPAERDRSLELLNRRLAFLAWCFAVVFGAGTIVIAVALEVGYYWAIALLLSDGLSAAGTFGGLLIAAFGAAAFFNLLTAFGVAMDRNRAPYWGFLAVFGIVGVLLVFLLRRRPEKTCRD